MILPQALPLKALPRTRKYSSLTKAVSHGFVGFKPSGNVTIRTGLKQIALFDTQQGSPLTADVMRSSIHHALSSNRVENLMDIRNKIVSSLCREHPPGAHILALDGTFCFDDHGYVSEDARKEARPGNKASCVWQMVMTHPGTGSGKEPLPLIAMQYRGLNLLRMIAQIDLRASPAFAFSVRRSHPSLGHIATSPTSYARHTDRTNLAIAGQAASVPFMHEMMPLTHGPQGRSIKGAFIPRLVRSMVDSSDKCYVDTPRTSKQADAVVAQHAALSAVARQAAHGAEHLWASVHHEPYERVQASLSHPVEM